MAQNPWLEMFDKRRSELHQLEYLRQQIADSQAARAQRGQEFQRGLADNVLDRGLRQQQLDQAAKAQKNAENTQAANLLMGNWAPTVEGEQGDVTIGDKGFNAPHPLFNAMQKQMFEQASKDQEVEQAKTFFEGYKIPPMLYAPVLADIMAGRNVTSNWSLPEMFVWQANVANDLNTKPTEKAAAKQFIEAFSRASSGGRGSAYPPGHINTAAINSAAGQMRNTIAQMVGSEPPNTPAYNAKWSAAYARAREELVKSGLSPTIINQASNVVLGRGDDVRTSTPNQTVEIMRMLMGGQGGQGIPTYPPQYGKE